MSLFTRARRHRHLLLLLQARIKLIRRDWNGSRRRREGAKKRLRRRGSRRPRTRAASAAASPASTSARCQPGTKSLIGFETPNSTCHSLRNDGAAIGGLQLFFPSSSSIPFLWRCSRLEFEEVQMGLVPKLFVERRNRHYQP